MFGKLFSRITEKSSEHPLGSDENLDALIDDIPENDPVRVVLDVGHWLEGMDGHAEDIGTLPALHALLRLEEFARPATLTLLARYLASSGRDYLSDSIWSVLDNHAAQLFRCHVAALNKLVPVAESESDRLRLARSAALALRAWAMRKKLQRFRYRTPPAALWQEAHELMRLMARKNLLQVSVSPFRQEQETTPINEYLIGVYLELVPVGNLLPPQLEVIDTFLRVSQGLEFAAQPQAAGAYRIDLASATGPRRVGEGEVGGATVRYCSTGRLRGPVMKVAAELKKGDGIPSWLTGVAASEEQISGALLTLALHWGSKPPSRGSSRMQLDIRLKAVFGFDLVRRMIAYSHFARSGRSLEYEGADVHRMFEESRFGTVALPTAPEQENDHELPPVINPLDTLQKLELAGDRAQMENWKQIDASDTGLGAIVPTILMRHRIGALVGIRDSEGLEWHTGIIRRIGRDADNHPSIGLETLDWPSLCAMAKPVSEGRSWQPEADAGNGWCDAILTGHADNEILLPAHCFSPGLEVDARSEEGLWRLRLESLRDRGPDYDRIEYIRLS